MKLLFVCTHNRCRSILCEAIANHLGAGLIDAASAGSEPAGQVHPLTLRYLTERQIPVTGLASKSWNDLNDEPDVVITVCDSAAREPCPLWLGSAPKVHWGLMDPSKITASDEECRQAFFRVMDRIDKRIRALVASPELFESRDRLVARLMQLQET